MARKNEALAPAERIAHRIVLVRGEKVLLDADLAELYGVSTGRLNEQVRRNLARFPGDFLFQLTNHDLRNLKTQFATSSWGGRRKLPLIEALRALTRPPEPTKRPIGFMTPPEKKSG